MSDTPRTDAQYGFVTALRAAKERVEDSSLYKRFIDGTPLSNDIAVWIAQAYCEGADFARQLERELAETLKQRDTLAGALQYVMGKAMLHRLEPDDDEIQCADAALAALKGGFND